jgi:adenine-specific DNA methylase
MKDRAHIIPITETIPEERQVYGRYYGVHPYFTRRSAKVIQQYIKRFTQPGDVVCDPFGGTGVTSIEALLLGRRAIHNDLNPFANFLAEVVADTSFASFTPIVAEFQKMESICCKRIDDLEKSTDTQVATLLKNLPLPENIALPRNSDADTYYDLFTPRQLAGLAILKEYIDSITSVNVRHVLLLAWSASMSKLNKTFISSKGRAESRGGSSIFSIYRYKIAKQHIELPIWDTFKGRFENVLSAKKEVLQERDHFNSLKRNSIKIDSANNMRIYSSDVCSIPNIVGADSVDYIYTDPPYGGHIAYLDLSIMWNHWLGFTVSEERRAEEAIVGGDLKHSEAHYLGKLERSVEACFKILKQDRWISIVFQHWNSAYFRTIMQASTECGGELKAAVTQERDTVWSMHKKKNAESVLAAEMMLTFYKPNKSARRMRQLAKAPRLDVGELLEKVLSLVPAEKGALSNDYLFNQLIIMAWEYDSLSTLEVTKECFVEFLKNKGWIYNTERHGWTKSASSANKQPALWAL